MFQLSFIDLPAFTSCNFQREAVSSIKIDVVIEDAAKVHEVMHVNRLYCVAYLFLEFRDFAFVDCSVDSSITFLLLLFLGH